RRMVWAAGATVLAAGLIIWPGPGDQSLAAEVDFSRLENLPGAEKIPPPPRSLADQKIQIDPNEPISLAQFIDLALSNNPSTRQAWQEARAAAAELGQARSPLYPQVSIQYDLNYQRAGPSLGADDFEETNWGPTLKLNYLLLDAGSRSAAITQALEQLSAASQQYRQTLQDLLLSVEEAYYNYTSAHMSIAAAEASLGYTQTALEVAEDKHKVGLIGKADVLQAQANKAEAAYQLEAARGQVMSAWINLSQVAGLPLHPPLKAALPAQIRTDLVNQPAKELVKKAIEQRADLKALRATIKSSQAAVEAARAKMWPSLSTELQVEFNDYSDKDPEFDYAAFLVVSYDLFTGFSNSYGLIAAQAKAQAAQAQLASIEHQTATAVLVQYTSYQTALHAVRSSQAYLASAEASHELQLALYKQGQAAMVDVVNAQTKLADARVKLVQAKTRVYLAVARLAHASGAMVLPEEKR
ncbi:MAG: TolC family protein, partial [Deltaproteobacteria bacterium]|nr:TolC family protein [Deltaproteobacteria bacterium]